MNANEKKTSEYIALKDFDNALLAYQRIIKNDSLNPAVSERKLNRFGYDFLKKKDGETAIEIFTINTILYPKSSNTFDSLADGFLFMKDTINAIVHYKKALMINPENRSSKKAVQKLTRK